MLLTNSRRASESRWSGICWFHSWNTYLMSILSQYSGDGWQSWTNEVSLCWFDRLQQWMPWILDYLSLILVIVVNVRTISIIRQEFSNSSRWGLLRSLRGFEEDGGLAMLFILVFACFCSVDVFWPSGWGWTNWSRIFSVLVQESNDWGTIKFWSFSHATCEAPGESSRMGQWGTGSTGHFDPGISALGVATCWRTGRR